MHGYRDSQGAQHQGQTRDRGRLDQFRVNRNGDPWP